MVLNTAVTNPAAIGVNLKIPSFRKEAILRVASHFVTVPLEELESTESRDNLYVMKQRKEKENSVLVVQDVSSKIVFSVVVACKVSIALYILLLNTAMVNSQTGQSCSLEKVNHAC